MNQIQLFHYKFPTKLIGLLIAAPIATTLFFTLTPHQIQQTPYRYNFSPSLPGTENRRATLQQEITFYQEKVRQNPDSALNLTALAQTYLKMAKATGESNWYLLAEQAAQRSLSHLQFNNQGAIIVLARIAQARHDFTEAIRLSQEVLKQQPNNDNALAILVTSNLAMGKLPQAKIAADTLVNKIPTQGNLTLQALVLVAQGQDKAALETFKYALAAEEPGELGTSAWTRILLGQFHYKHGQLELAENLYKEALRIIPRYPLALLHLAELETRKGNYQTAENFYAQVLPKSQKSATIFDHAVLRGKAKLQQLQGKEVEANQLLNQAEILLRQENATGHSNGSFGHRRELARLLLEKNNPQDTAEALSLMEAEIKIRSDAQTLDTLAWALLRSGRLSAAQENIQAALQLGTKDAGIYYRAGIIAKALGNQEQALNYEKLAQNIDPSFDDQARRMSGLGLDNLGI
ncbi:tetratricopeptide repeat protein [Calothrix sp. FACHB-1219]|uniref:tetratricopeptide repeat protein n=1 Tax=unclassified Calothrix TaxID=2619626 RepID=UPI00168625D7|nr:MULTISPECIES: tetratricopeptide repeat protein [unclassified Calothrix]MBD2204630.1 tetratricopeptide repeat protein [Calothrix sp. FACHB-168]MBD2216858.1 tetratricopeptide repeat protein [Calothrix sp. FACHB-1219]